VTRRGRCSQRFSNAHNRVFVRHQSGNAPTSATHPHYPPHTLMPRVSAFPRRMFRLAITPSFTNTAGTYQFRDLSPPALDMGGHMAHLDASILGLPLFEFRPLYYHRQAYSPARRQPMVHETHPKKRWTKTNPTRSRRHSIRCAPSTPPTVVWAFTVSKHWHHSSLDMK